MWERAFVLGLLVLAFGAYLYVWPHAPVIDGDSAQYLAVAADMADGRLDALHFRTPGYPLLLVLTGSIETPTRLLFVVSLVLHLASVLMLASLLRKLNLGRPWIASVTVILLLPPFVEPSAYVMTENLAQALLVAGFCCLVVCVVDGVMLYAIAAGAAFGSAALVRPVYQGLLPFLALAFAILAVSSMQSPVPRAAIARKAGVLLAAWGVIVGGYAVANSARFGWFGVTPSLGFHLSTKTIGFVERLPEEYAGVREILVRARDAELVKRGGTHTGTQAIWSARDELREATGLSEPELSSFLVRMNLVLIRRAPIEYLQDVARSCAVYWFPAAGRLAAMDSAMLRWLWIALHGALVLILALELAVVAGLASISAVLRRVPASRAWHANRHQLFTFGLALAIVFYTMALSCFLDIGEPRQRRPTDALFVTACVLGLAIWRQIAADLAPRQKAAHTAA